MSLSAWVIRVPIVDFQQKTIFNDVRKSNAKTHLMSPPPPPPSRLYTGPSVHPTVALLSLVGQPIEALEGLMVAVQFDERCILGIFSVNLLRTDSPGESISQTRA